ncbi:Crp/Fnr family transcriptional regulator [Chitinimonas sp. BJYL2]|uniref:Crp/Fnr family transcriptional regulator n=1 Tax=Chitinimonas sp. BJYL2 TaxID=2976696 RepID=UPI0022B57F3D|nr:cyclic nucleotide-binding domain-containing protein [Chitinimonas sp. BJYL2]
MADTATALLKQDPIDLRHSKSARAQIESSEALTELDGSEIDYLLGLLLAYTLPKGTVLFQEGDAANYMGMVLDGRLTVSKRNDEASGKPLYSMSAGKVFGEMALLDGEPRSATLVAAVDCEVALLSREAFDRLCRERPVIGVKLLRRIGRLLSQRLRRASGLLVDYLP